MWYQPTSWPRAYRYLVKREKKQDNTGQKPLFEEMSYSYYVVVTNREGDIRELMNIHAKRAKSERRICQYTNEFLCHLPMGEFMANWVYLLCAQLAYNISLWIRDLVLPRSYRRKHIKRIRRCIGLVAGKVLSGGRQIKLKISSLHHWWKDFVFAWEKLATISMAAESG